MTTGAGNPETMLSQKVDNVAPRFAVTNPAPAIDDIAMFIVNDPVTTEGL